MVGEQNPQDIRELTAWLEADDAKSRAMRATRLRDLLDILPVPSDGLSFLGGEQSVLCFEEIRRCYLDRSDMAVVLLCLAYSSLYGLEPCEESFAGEWPLCCYVWRTPSWGICATRTPTSARPALLAIRQFPALGPSTSMVRVARRHSRRSGQAANCLHPTNRKPDARQA